MSVSELAVNAVVPAATAATPAASPAGPRAVDPAAGQRFRELMAAPECDPAASSCAAQPTLSRALNLDIEQVLMANLPPPDASAAEYAMGLLRAQVKVSQAAIAIEMVNKTTQSLSQGVQSLTTRS